MPPTDRFVPRFAAEPPQEPLPYGRWADTLQAEFLSACAEVDTEGEQIGEPEGVVWFPERTYGGRTYVPATSVTSEGYELFGFVSFVPADGTRPAGDFTATADFTDETAERNPEWQLDLCDEVVAVWRGPGGKTADVTLVWGTALVGGGAVATAELLDLSVDQCELDDARFTLVAPDNHRGDFLDIVLYSASGGELARESLYTQEDDEGEAEQEAPADES